MQGRICVLIYAFASLTHEAANDNSAEFNAICNVLALTQGVPALPLAVAPTSVAKAMQELEYLNISTSTETYYNSKDGLLATGSGGDTQQKQKDWATKLQEIHKADATTGIIKFKRLDRSNQRDQANQQLITIQRKAANLQASITREVEGANARGATAIRKLNDALYGTAKNAFDGSSVDAAGPQVCGGTGGHAKADGPLLNALYCLCVGMTNAATNLCKHGTTPTPKAHTDPNDQKQEQLNSIIEECNVAKRSTKLTPDTIASAATGVKALLGRYGTTRSSGPGHAYLGKPTDAQGCNGQGDQGMCVNYQVQLSSSGSGIKWLADLEAAAESLRESDSKRQRIYFLETTLDNLLTTAWGAYNAARHTPPTQATGATAAKDKPDNTDQKKECEQRKSNKTTCENTGKCKWNGESETKGECKPKDEEEQPNTATGTGTAGTNAEGKKCSDKKTEGDCKDGCKWDGKECKDYSILVNNQFALSVVSAAFAALLF
uniref:Variable surface glycoprotein n=1 Tax=Trypanosoma evansi TaxID=5697 RepID=Q968M2_TRYEV|nr:variable surface glycoprotein [Trypanosoma evansi]